MLYTREGASKWKSDTVADTVDTVMNVTAQRFADIADHSAKFLTQVFHKNLGNSNKQNIRIVHFK